MPFHTQPLFFLAMGLIAGTLAPLPGASPSLFAALALAFLIAIAAIVRPGSVPLAALLAASAAAGAALAADARAAHDQRSLRGVMDDVSGPVLLEGRVASDPRRFDEEMRVDVESVRWTGNGDRREYHGRVRVFVRGLSSAPDGPEPSVRKGDEVTAWVELRRPEPVRTPGGFDQLEWAKREGIHAFATCKSERLFKVAKGRPGRAWIDQARDRLKESWRRVEDPLNRAVTASMVLGDEGALDATTRDEFRSAGLLHLLVVSGSQVAALILGLRRALPPRLRIAWSGCVIECVVLLAYCALAGAGDSIVRATAMAMAFAVAVRVDLHRGGANFLFASALVLLALRPLDALDAGAQMSFATALALVAFAGDASRRLESFGAPAFLSDILAATLVASLAVAPLTLLHFHRLSLIAIPANLLAAPLAVLLLYASIATAVLDSVVPPLASLGGWVCGAAALALRFLAHHAAAIDPDWRGPSPPLPLVLGLIGGVALAGWRRKALPFAGLLASLTLSALPAGDGRVHVWFLDVGQGDAILVETPAGRVGAIDAGPAFEEYDAGERVVGEALWRLGHVRLDFMAVTHRHSDHEGGARFLARHFAPERVYVNAESRTLRDLKPVTVRRGDSWMVDGVAFRILAPDPDWPLPAADENARSLVVEMTYGDTAFLLMGDASTVTEGLLPGPERRYDVVKVGHHGASTSSSPSFVRGAHPRLAVISVGWRNRFSHPSAAVVGRWSERGAVVWRTDVRHTLHVTSDGRTIAW